MIRRAVRRSARLTALARGVRAFVGGVPAVPDRPAAAPTADPAIPELRPIEGHASGMDEWRVNLLIPTVDPGATFGGPSTALDLFDAIVPAGVPRRIVTQVEPGRIPDRLRDHERREPLDEVLVERSLVSLRPGAPVLSVGRRDVFMATFWNTADAAFAVHGWQQERFGWAPPYVAYAIQDFEPGFYPWSAQYLLAQATYRHPGRTVAIFNSGLLQRFFEVQGLSFAHRFTFEPRLAAELRPFLRAPRAARERRIVVYGRPKTPRNAFPLIVEGLRRWRASDRRAADWEVVSAGQAHGPVDLGGGCVLRSLGKLDIEAYGRLLATSAVGVALMVSPHPSYPPLDMAALGLQVVTNAFDGKDLSRSIPSIASLDDPSPATLGAALGEACRRAMVDHPTGSGLEGRGMPEVPAGLGDYLDEGPAFPFASRVAALLLSS